MLTWQRCANHGGESGSAALLYPAVVMFVLLCSALVFDTFTLFSHERHLAHQTQALGRHALTHFDRDIYRATGMIIVAQDVSDAIIATTLATMTDRQLFDTLDCALESAPNHVNVRCDATVKRGVFAPRVFTQITVSRRLIATQHCQGCTSLMTVGG